MINIRDINSVIKLHDKIIGEFGGRHGVVDVGLLKAAIEKPFMGLSDGTEYYPNTVEKAAVLFEAIVNYHAFVDGNKRLATIVTSLYLKEKGYLWNFNDKEIVDFCVKVAEKRLAVNEIKKWIENRIKHHRTKN